MPSTPLHHGIRLMPDDLYAYASQILPAAVIRTKDDIVALGDRFYAPDTLNSRLVIPSLEILKDPTLTSTELTRLIEFVRNEIHRYRIPKRADLVEGRSMRRLNETLLLMAQAIKEGRLVPSPENQQAVRDAFKPRAGRPTRDYAGAMAALADAVNGKGWDVGAASLQHARDQWEQHLPHFKEELKELREAAEGGWGAGVPESTALAQDIPLLSLDTPFDVSAITATPIDPARDLPWAVPPHLRTLDAWRGRDLRYQKITDGLRMFAREPHALDEILESIEAVHPDKVMRARAELGGAPLASTDLLWERLTTRLNEARRARDTDLALHDFEEAVATDPAGMPATVYHAALTASRRFVSLDFPLEALFTFPLTARNTDLWWEMFFQTIDRANASEVSARIDGGRLAQHIQRLAHPELAEALQTPPAAVLAGSRAAQAFGVGLDLRLGFALSAPPVARLTPPVAPAEIPVRRAAARS